MNGADDGVAKRRDAATQEHEHHGASVLAQRIDALARRAAREHGGVRQLLDARVAELVALHDREGARPATPSTNDTPSVQAHGPSSLAGLLGAFERDTRASDDTRAATAPSRIASHHVDDVRRASSRARMQSRVRQALGRPPENAGPLNSVSLVHRALGLMRDLSPAYLQSFVAYVDGLAQLETLLAGDAPPRNDASVAPGGRRPRSRARDRRG